MTQTTFVPLVLACSLAACSIGTEPPPEVDHGFVLLPAEPGGDQDRMEPTAYFYRTNRPIDIPSDGEEGDRCTRGPASPPANRGIQPTISAGPSVTLSVSGTEATLTQLIRPAVRFYGVSTGSPVMFVAGDTATVDIPGESAWFPAWNVEVKTAEAFDATPIPTYEKPTPIELAWTVPDADDSRMIVTLRYTVGLAAEQVLCNLFDDGAHVLPADWVDAWRTASRFSKSATFVRERVVTYESERSKLTVVTTYEVGG